jgi:dihydroneopterin aldolase
VTTTTIELEGLELFGRHGVLDEERRHGQPFLVDLRLELVSHPTGDRIEEAVDYREIVACVREVFDARQVQLLETLAADLADALLGRFPLASARVRVRKPAVQLAVPVGHSAVTVERP